jgi:dienelactone hydrolase
MMKSKILAGFMTIGLLGFMVGGSTAAYFMADAPLKAASSSHSAQSGSPSVRTNLQATSLILRRSGGKSSQLDHQQK